MKFIPTIFIFLLHFIQSNVSLSQKINVYTYTTQDGLVNNDVLNIYQDQKGFIWICTRGGLSRYDGTRFTNYTTENGLTNDMINDIYEIAPGEFIIAQNLNGPRILKEDSIVAYPSPTNLIINNIYKFKDRVLATTDFNGIIELTKDGFRQLNLNNKGHVHNLAFINDSVWLINRQQGSIQLVTPEFRAYSPESPIISNLVYRDKQQRTWVGTPSGLKMLSPHQERNSNIEFIPLPGAFNIPLIRDNIILDIFQDSQNNLWICTTVGLTLVRPDGTSKVFTEFDGLPVSSVSCIFEDRQRNIWIGTLLGLAKLSILNDVRIFTSRDGFPTYGSNLILPISKDRLRLFNHKGSLIMDKVLGEFSKLPLADSSFYYMYRLNNKEALQVKGKNATIYEDGTEYGKPIDLPSLNFWDIKRIDSELFIASCSNSLFRMSGSQIKDSVVFAGYGSFSALELYNNNFLMAGTTNSGIYKIRLGKDKMEMVDSITRELPDMHIRCMFSDRENELWVGTRYGGLIRVEDKGSGKYSIQQYGIAQGLSSNIVMRIQRDSKGNIWVGTTHGVDKLTPDREKYKVFNFGKINKISYQVQDILFFENDYLLAAGYPYVTVCKDIQLDTMAPSPTYITKIKADLEKKHVSKDQPATLPYNKAQIYFEFSTPQFINETVTRHWYRLLGSNDTNWIVSGNSRSVSFANLKPGKYTFEVKALGFNGEWGSIAFHHFIVAAPFWEKTWFILLSIATIAMLLIALYRYRIHQLMRLQKVRNNIAADLHDEIGSNLTNISILSNLSKKNIARPREATEFLQRISQEVASSSQALDDIIWSVNSNHDTLDETVSRMRRYAAELFDAANIQYDLSFDPRFEDEKLVMEQRRDIYLLYKEAVNNIYKHAQAKKVSIAVALKQNALILDIEDDGKGFLPMENSDRHGLQAMKSRVEKWKGTINISSAQNSGTFIHCRIPLAR